MEGWVEVGAGKVVGIVRMVLVLNIWVWNVQTLHKDGKNGHTHALEMLKHMGRMNYDVCGLCETRRGEGSSPSG